MTAFCQATEQGWVIGNACWTRAFVRRGDELHSERLTVAGVDFAQVPGSCGEVFYQGLHSLYNSLHRRLPHLFLGADSSEMPGGVALTMRFRDPDRSLEWERRIEVSAMNRSGG